MIVDFGADEERGGEITRVKELAAREMLYWLEAVDQKKDLGE